MVKRSLGLDLYIDTNTNNTKIKLILLGQLQYVIIFQLVSFGPKSQINEEE